jgi:hypothetical protein
MKSKREFSRSWGKLFLLFIALSVVLIAPVIGFLSVIDGWVVWGKGQYLSHSQGPVYKVGVVDLFTLFVEPERGLETGMLRAVVLAAVAVVSLLFGVVLIKMKRGSIPQPGRFFLYVSFVVSFLAADEFLRIHGILGRNLRLLGHLPFIDHPAQGVVALGGVLAVLLLLKYRETILASRLAFGLMGIAVAFFVTGAMNDSSGLPAEQMSGLLGPVCCVVSLMVLGISHVRTAIVDMRPAASPLPSFTLFGREDNGLGVETSTTR